MVPRIWNVPNRNADFTGRGSILERLHDELGGDGTAVVLARAVYGLGGVGKTQVALEYAHRFKADYRLIWWINAEQPLEITRALAELADRLDLPIGDTTAEAAAAALEQLRRDVTGQWLLIFDNAEDPEDLALFLPTGSGHILITSRNQAWTRHAEPVELDVFSPQESLAHLMHHVPGTRRGRCDQGVNRRGPLASGYRAGGRLVGGDRHARRPIRRMAGDPDHQYTGPEQAARLRGARCCSLEPFDRPAQAGSPASVRLLQILAFCSPGPDLRTCSTATR